MAVGSVPGDWMRTHCNVAVKGRRYVENASSRLAPGTDSVLIVKWWRSAQEIR